MLIRAMISTYRKDANEKGIIYIQPSICAMNSIREDDRDAGNASPAQLTHILQPSFQKLPCFNVLLT